MKIFSPKGLVLVLLLGFNIGLVGAQTNPFFIGKILNKAGQPILESKIFIQGQRDTVLSDFEGNFKIQSVLGLQTFVCLTEGYQDLKDTIRIYGDVYRTLVLENIEIQSIGEAKITSKRKSESTVEGSIKAKQISLGVIDVISAEDFSKTTIRTTSDAIKRIPGATIMEGKFANIRGMFDRYNLGMLNGAPLPSTESDRKAFSFDVIPSSLLDNIKVIKSSTPEMPADFGGGIIMINTKSIPTKLSQTISFGFQTNSITSFSNQQTFKVGSSEWIGFPGSSRRIPELDPGFKPGASNPALQITETQKFNNDWSTTSPISLPMVRFSYTIGLPRKIGKKEIGILISINHSSSQKYSEGKIENRDYSTNYIYKSFDDQILSTNIQNGIVSNFSLKFNQRNKIDFRNLLTTTYDVGSTFRSGISDKDNNMYGEGYSNQVNYNRLIISQLSGSHTLNKKKEIQIQWIMNLGNTSRSIPDFRIAQYSIQDGDRSSRALVLNDFFNAGSGRFFSDMKETNLSFSSDYFQKIFSKKHSMYIKSGIYVQNRERQFSSRNFVYGPVGSVVFSQFNPDGDLSPEGLSRNNIYLKEKTSKDKDEYNGSSSLYAGYIQLENRFPIFKIDKKSYDLKVIYGIRVEKFRQILQNDYFSKLGSIQGKELYMSNTGSQIDLLPSININLPISKKSNLRGAYYKTLNRPELRELAPFAFYNFSINSEILGNPNLQRALIENSDCRYEIYSRKEDMVSVGLFYKKISNPIEFNLDVTQSLIRTFYYRNEKTALNRGIEIEIRKNLGNILTHFKWTKNFTFYGNLSLVHSEIKFSPESQNTYNRPLQGQSPYIINVSLFYQNKKGWQINTSFNKIGQRIAYIGSSPTIQPFGADIMEFGRSVWDFQISKDLNKKSNIKLTIGDLLAQKTVFYQDLNKNGKYDSLPHEKGGDNTLFSFTNGRTFTFSYSLNF